MSISLSDIVDLLANANVRRAQDEIAAAVGTYVNGEHLAAIHQFLLRDIGLSGLTKDEVLELVSSEPDALASFGIALLRDAERHRREYEKETYPKGEEPIPGEESKVVRREGLADGFGLTYAIYLFYIRHKSVDELAGYLKKVRVPGPAAFARRLVRLSTTTG
jgi:hypothetical protein